MKHGTSIIHLGRALLLGYCIAVMSCPQSARACAGSGGAVCVVAPGACTKSMVLAKAGPMTVVVPPFGTIMFGLPMNLFITCPLTNNCGVACTNAPGVLSASLTANLYPGPPCPPVGPLPPPTVSGAISTAAGTMVLPLCSGPGVFNSYVVPIPVPAGTPPGLYCVVGVATVAFADGTTLTQSGDTVICLVDPVPGMPGVPRLEMQLLSPNFPRLAPGDQAVATYRVINRDPVRSVTLTAFANSRQASVRPQGANEAQGVFSISAPFGDDFPIAFDPSPNCVPLPEHPYTQPEIVRPLPVLMPGQTNTITVRIRSYGQCASGSCSESTLRVQGTFSDGSPAFACAGMALYADTGVPSQNCGTGVSDCNHNGIPDALDISSRRSQDRNFNALPDECEEYVSIPIAAGVSPTLAQPGAPIFTQVAFNEVFPMANVWANGIPLARTQFFGSPFWIGTIPADTRPGPQTVYFLGKDAAGALSTYIATYAVEAPPQITITRLTRGDELIHLRWQGATPPYTLEKKSDLSSPTWMPILTTSGTNATVGSGEGNGFVRVVSGYPCPVPILDPLRVPHTVFNRVHLPGPGATTLPGPFSSFAMTPPLSGSDPYLPCQDFQGQLAPNGALGLIFQRIGVYVVETIPLGGGAPVYWSCSVGVPGNGSEDGLQPDGTDKEITVKAADVTVVETPAGGDNGFDDRAAGHITGEVRASTVQGAVDAICAAYMANGNKPVRANLVGHGAPGRQNMGRGQGNGNATEDEEFIGKRGTSTGKTDTFVNGVKGKVSELCFSGCEVGMGADGEAFLQDIANRVSNATTKTKVGGFRRKTNFYSDKAWVGGDEKCKTNKTEKTGT